MIATLISIIKGMDAILVINPIINKRPKTISTTPTKGAKNSGAGMPIL